MSLQTMTQIPLSHDDHNRIRCPTFNPKSTSSFTAPSNPNEYLNFYQTYRYPTHTESQTSSSFSHDAQSHHDDPRTSQLSNGPSSLSSSTMASASNAKVTQIRSFDPSQPTVPAAALILASSPEPTSISDNRGFSWHEQREWEQTKNDMALGTLVAEPVSQRRRTLDSVVDTEEDDDEEEEDDEAVDTSDHENAFYILLRISFVVPPFSIVAAIYTFFVVLFLIFAAPLRLCPPTAFFKSPNTFSAQICQSLLPLLRFHQQLISTPSPSQRRRERHPYHQSSSRSPSHSRHNSPDISHLDTQQSNSSRTSPCCPPSCNLSIPWLILIHLLSPVFIIPILFAAWISAFFWIFAMIVGNPDGTERKDDGRAAVLWVRDCWKIWLSRARRREKRNRSGNQSGSVV